MLQSIIVKIFLNLYSTKFIGLSQIKNSLQIRGLIGSERFLFDKLTISNTFSIAFREAYNAL